MKFRLPPRLYVVQIPLPQPSSCTKKDISAKSPEVSTVSPHRYTMCHGGTVGTGKSKTQTHAFEFASCFLHKDRASQERKRQTSPRIKGRHLKASCCSLGWRSIIFEAYSILPGHLQEAAFQPMPHPFYSVPAHFAEPKADSGTDQGHSPSPFPSGCRSCC